MTQPTTQLEEVLFMLLNYKEITYQKAFFNSGIINLTARISDLRNVYFLDVPCKKVETKNKFGRTVHYGSWSLSDKNQAKVIYNKLTAR